MQVEVNSGYFIQSNVSRAARTKITTDNASGKFNCIPAARQSSLFKRNYNRFKTN